MSKVYLHSDNIACSAQTTLPKHGTFRILRLEHQSRGPESALSFGRSGYIMSKNSSPVTRVRTSQRFPAWSGSTILSSKLDSYREAFRGEVSGHGFDPIPPQAFGISQLLAEVNSSSAPGSTCPGKDDLQQTILDQASSILKPMSCPRAILFFSASAARPPAASRLRVFSGSNWR